MSGSRRNTVVLVVEDDLIVRMSVAESLGEAGFTVLEAGDADEAIVLLEQRSDIAIIFTDVQMPGSMDGLKLAHAVKDRWPPIKIVVASGRLDIRADQLPASAIFFQKPYSSMQITDTLSRLAGE